jgi:hypothetical protein
MSIHRNLLVLARLVGIMTLSVVVHAPWVSPTAAQAAGRSFDNGDFKGTYAGGFTAFLLSADDSSPPTPGAGVLRIEADGAGNLTLHWRKNAGGTSGSKTASCHYVIEPLGFGTIECPADAFEPSRTMTLILSDGGKQLDFFLEGSIAIGGGHLIRQGRGRDDD